MHAMTGLHQPAIKEPSPRKDPRQKGGHMPPRCRSKGERCFIKCDRHEGADSRTDGHLTCNQTPAYIRGSGPLD
jgi:hypothetical protein